MPTPETQDSIRQYLLGQLSDGARDEVELNFLTHDDWFEELRVLEDELVDEYLAGRLSPADRSDFENYFLATKERADKLRFARTFDKYLATQAGNTVNPSSAPRFALGTFLSSPVKLAAAATLLVVVALGIWAVFFRVSDLDEGLLALNTAYREQRLVEARISRLDYAPFANTRGPGTARVDEIALHRAERVLLDEVSENPSPAAYHGLGRLYLAERKFDQALTQLENALKGDPNNPGLHADLGAALLEKEKADYPNDDSGKGFPALAKSLEHLNKALGLNSSLPEALFNRALVHEEMGLLHQAVEDWKNYLKVDPGSRWAEEAKRHIAELEQRIKKSAQITSDVLPRLMAAHAANDREGAWHILRHSREASAVANLIRDQLLDKYLHASTAGATRNAESEMQILTFVGSLELQKTGDPYTSELAHFYGSALPRHRELLTQARELMKQGRASYSQARPLAAINHFEQAKLLFDKAGDRWESQNAELWVGYSALNASDNQRSAKILEPLVLSFERKNYRWLAMRARHFLSGAEYNLGKYSRAIDQNLRSLAMATEMGDTVGAFSILSILIEQYRYIGNYDESLSCIRKSLPLLETSAVSPNQIGQYFGVVASVHSSLNLFAAAADYQKEAVRHAVTTAQIQTISRGYASLGSIYGKLGDFARALETTKLAYETARSHSDASIRKGMMAYSARQLGDLYKQFGEIPKAIESYDESLELYQSLDNYYGVYEAHKNRLSCYLVQGNDAAVKAEIQTTLALIDRNRSELREGDNRNRFFDVEQSVYDLAIDFEFSRMNDKRKAFKYSEESRARSLLELVNSNAPGTNEPLDLSEVQRRIPNDVQIVQYSVLNDKLLIWFVSKTSFSAFESRVTQAELDRTVRRYLQTMSSPAPQTSEAAVDARKLFEILIKPIQPAPDRTKPIYLIPDKILNYLPFGTLVSPDTNRFLVEDYLTAVSPSSSLLIISSELAGKKDLKKVERLLSVGNPHFDRLAFPTLAPLPSAAKEAKDVAEYYDSNIVLTGHAARKGRVQSEMQKSDIIHFALHSVFDQRSPLGSKLLLTKPSNTSAAGEIPGGFLEAREIYQMNLSSTRLVVLSACASGVEQYFGGEGMMSLARPFLAAKVPLIVASFWPVDSESTQKLMTTFHRRRRRDQVTTVAALRRAQLDMLGSSDERLRQPYCWASFTAVGGWTSF